LASARHRRNREEPYDPLGSLIEKHAGQLLEDFDAPPASEGARREEWLDRVGKRAEKEIKKAERATREERRAAARRIEALPEESQLWGT
jgi:hypothetical protein